MELSRRLKLISSYVDKCDSLIDVGTDHGYIPIYLIKKGICNSAIASDINKGPIEKAKFNVSIEGLKDKISCRLGGGLKTIKQSEVESVIIAGMGGNLTRDILIEDINKVKKFKFLILQPAQNPEILREYLYKNNYEVLAEDVCFDEGKFYELFKVRYSEKTKPYEIKDSIDLEVSPIIRNSKNEIVKVFISDKISKYENILKYIKEDTESAKRRKVEIKNKIIKFKEML